MKILKFAVIGTGFWSAFQVAAWRELPGTEIIACYNRTRPKANALAQQFDIPYVYDNIDQLLDRHTGELDFVDIITDVDTHTLFVNKAAERGLDVICQKPMGPSRDVARQMVQTCQEANVRFYVHENFRWQTPIRQLKTVLNSGVIGQPFKARVSFCSGFPVFANQPFLAELDQFILTDIGSHVLDICRFLFGEAQSLYCRTARVNPQIKGEDVANVMMNMENGLTCYAEMSYASILERETFPQTLVHIEGEHGSIELTHDFVIRTTSRRENGQRQTEQQTANPPVYAWADPAYAVVHSSIVACNRNILADLQGTGSAETIGADNLKTIELVYAAYDSAAQNRVVSF